MGANPRASYNGPSKRGTTTLDKWDKLKRHYQKKNKLHNVAGDNACSQWIWFSMIDEVLSGITKVDEESGNMNNDWHVRVNDQPPSESEENHSIFRRRNLSRQELEPQI